MDAERFYLREYDYHLVRSETVEYHLFEYNPAVATGREFFMAADQDLSQPAQPGKPRSDKTEERDPRGRAESLRTTSP